MTVQARPSARCRKLLLELSRYLDGELTPARRRTVERHVAECQCCGTMAARLRKAVAACRAVGGSPPPRDVRSRAADRIRALIAQGAPQPNKVTRRNRACF
jgi:anti-sigma factor RsiW